METLKALAIQHEAGLSEALSGKQQAEEQLMNLDKEVHRLQGALNEVSEVEGGMGDDTRR